MHYEAILDPAARWTGRVLYHGLFVPFVWLAFLAMFVLFAVVALMFLVIAIPVGLVWFTWKIL